MPVGVFGGLSFSVISAGVHSCGLTTSSEAYCWGNNLLGQLGNGSNTNSNVPLEVADP